MSHHRTTMVQPIDIKSNIIGDVSRSFERSKTENIRLNDRKKSRRACIVGRRYKQTW